ncbi:MAG: hypothetical protein U1E05_24040, partial [Patescibacteria group bacterium]|nr:hypothetical protein [Patescibacteria group bacterium]
MTSFADSLNLLYAGTAVPLDDTGSLERIAAIFAACRPAALFLANEERHVTAGWSATGSLDPELLQTAVQDLAHRTDGEMGVFIAYEGDAEHRGVFGVRLSTGGYFGGLLSPDPELATPATEPGPLFEVLG